MQILTYPNDSLKIKCKAVEKVTPELQAIAKEMFQVMVAANGLGLAANQVGLDIRLIVLLDGDKPVYMFNPVIMQSSPQKIVDDEGCLSAPGEFVKVKRSVEVKAKYRDYNNKMQYITLTGIHARAFLHEVDHLNGIDFRELKVKDDEKN